MKRLPPASAKVLTLLLCALLLFPPQLLAAGPVASGATNTTVSTAGNGVPVVNIAAPNAAGLSHNAYTSYNVDPSGLVLNNGNTSQAFRQSQLAGQVAANTNLGSGNQASIILNEVTGGGRSTLAGFTEVLGGKADVIVANPFGITCNGCGFINTDRVSLVTGAPNFGGGAMSFDVRGGDILISGTGMNANAQQILDLVSRRIDVQGQVNAKTLNMVAGANNWNHTSGAANVIAADGGAAPAYAIDSSALGGMYAGRISLKSTEAGVGVRIQREAAATADDFTITSAGKIEVTSKLSAARDMVLTSTATGADAIKATDANLSAARNLSLNASLGGATLTGGGMVAGGQLAYNLGTLTDTASATAGITDANKRYGATTNLVGTGAWSINGVSYGAGSALGLSTRSLTLGNLAETTFYSGGSMSLSAADTFTLANAGLQSVGDMTLAATDLTTGLLSIGSLARAKSTGGNMYLNVGKRTDNAGTLATTAGNIVIRTGLNAGGYSVPLQVGLKNTGAIWAGGLLDIADRNGAGTEQMEFSGTGKVGGRTVKISAANFDMFDTAALTSIGDMTLYLNGGYVASGAKMLAATGGVGTLTLQAPYATGWQGFTNYGLVHSGQDLDASTIGIGATPGKSGTVSAARDMKLVGFDRMAGNYIAGHDISFVGNWTANLFANADGSPSAVLSAGNDINITAYRLRNWGTINAGHNVNINVTGDYFFNAIGDKSSISMLYLEVVPNDDIYAPTDFRVVRNTSYTPQIIAGNAISISSYAAMAENVGLISAPTVTMSGGSMRNAGTIRGGSVTLSYAHFNNYAGGTSAPGAVSGTSLTPTPTPGGISFGGVSIALPTTPNGLFVPAQGNTSSYLVESNPLYTNIDNYLGSDYLIEKYNFKPDTVTKRLGDAAYETYLVRQQLITLTGSNIVVAGAQTEKAQMQALMDSAGAQAKSLGLTYGKGLSSTQQANLKEDMVWMVETTVNGQKVLAPVVYLAAGTRELFAAGAGGGLVAAETLTANVGGLTNTGTMRGNTVDIAATGDVQNLGGTISGGNVSVASTGGSVVNSALVSEQIIKKADGHIDLKTTVGKAGTIQGANVSLSAAKNVENVGGSIKGGSVNIAAKGDVVNSALVVTNVSGSQYRETVAATGGMESTGKLNIQAGRDVQNLGGQMKAGGDASISAGRDVTFDTVALTSRDSRTSSTRSFTKNENKRSTTTTTTQVQGGVAAGGALTMKAGQDVTLAAANVSAGKSATIDAAGDLNILARNNSVQTVTESNANGLNVGGGVFGKEKKTTDQFSSRAVSSTLTTVKVGGAESGLTNAKGSVPESGGINLSAGKTATLEGAKVNAAGAVNIAATDVQVLEARDVDRTTTHTESTSYLSTSGGDGDKSASATKAGVKSDGVVKAGANASSTRDAGGVDLMKTTTTDTFDESTKAVGTSLAAAGGINITAKKDATLRGADVQAGGDVSLSGQNVNILAAQDTHVSTSDSTTTKVGLYASTTNAADAKAGAGATANAQIGAASANAGATANANAVSSTSVDAMRTQTTATRTVDIVNKGTTLSSGGTLKIKSAEALTVQGSDLSGEKGVDMQAKDMAFLAAQDTHTSTTDITKTSAGLYVDGNANAAAAATSSANAGLGANAGAAFSANSSAVASVGVQGRNVTSSSSEGTSTARVSSIRSGSGSISRTAENAITDVGTNIDAAGDFSQSAKTIASKAAENTSYSTSSSVANTGKLGIYGKAEAGVTAEAGANAGLGLDGKPKAEAGAGTEASAKVGAGVKASYSRDSLNLSESSSEAVVSSIKAGGKITSASAGATSLEGTQLSAGQGVTLEAQSLDFAAAKSTTASSSSVGNTNASASAGVSRGTGKGVDVDVSGGTSKTDKSASSSTATAGSIASGGDIVIKTSGDTRLVGTNLAATGDTTVAAGGNLSFEAARDTASSSKTAYDASASLSVGKSSGAGSSSSGVDAGASGGFSKSSASSSTATAGSISTGGALSLSAGKAASFEGANMAAGGDATISAKDGVTISAAKSTSESEAYGGRVGVEASKGSETKAAESSTSKSAGATVEANYSRARQSTAEAGSLASGGSLKIVSGKDVTLEGTTLSAQDKAAVNAGGTVNFKAAESTSESVGVSASASASASKTDTTPTAAPAPAKAKTQGTGGTQGSDGSAQSNKDLAAWQKTQASVVQQLKDKQAASASAGAAAPAAGTAGKAAGAASSPAADSGPNTEKTSSVSAGVQAQTKNKTVQKAGGISAGAGGVEITAAGGDVNLVGTNISTTGDASIEAARNVNISATRSTESGVSVNVAGSADKKSETPAKAAAKPTGTSAAGTPTTGAASGKTATSGASAGNTVGGGGAAAGGMSPAAGATGSTGAGAGGAGGTGASAGGAGRPAPAGTGAGTTVSTPAPAAASGAVSSASAKTPPPVPTAPKPASARADAAAAARTAGTGAGTTVFTPAPAAPAAAASEAQRDPNTFKAEAKSSATTAKDPENTSSAFVGVGGGGSEKNQGATITTGGGLKIKSGGKTTLTNTSIQAAEGESIEAAGGVERKTERDWSVLNANTDSGAAGANQTISKVPMASGSGGTSAPGVPGTPGTGTDSAGTNAAPQSTLKAAQGGGTPAPTGVKKN